MQGIDISRTAVLWAEERFAAVGLVAFHEGAVRDMPIFGNRSFDVVIDGSCLHCLIGQDRTRCLRETRRILRPDGTLVVSSMCGSPKSDDAKASFDPKHTCLLKDGKSYRTLKPLPDLAAELTLAGFTVRESWLNANPWRDHVTMICRATPVDHTPSSVAISPA